jgi:predicted phosphodiesterase
MSMDPLAIPELIAFAGDWHMNGAWARSAIQHAGRLGADVIVHLGDFGFTYNDRYLLAVETALAGAGIPLLFVDGNHESPKLLKFPLRSNGLRQLTDHIWHLPRGFRWKWNGVRFLAMGGAHSVDRPWRKAGADWWPGETITAEQAAAAIAGGPADVLVSHDCPAGVVIPGVDDRGDDLAPFPFVELLRSAEHRQLLRTVADAARPRVIVHGHYHVSYSAVAEFGHGFVAAMGLDCDNTKLERNVRMVWLEELAPAAAR